MTKEAQWVSLNDVLSQVSIEGDTELSDSIRTSIEEEYGPDVPEELMRFLEQAVEQAGRGSEPCSNPHNLRDIARTRIEYEGRLSGGTPKEPLKIGGLVNRSPAPKAK